MGTKLTNRNIDSLVKQAKSDVNMLIKKEIILWDDEVIGLGLRVGHTKTTWLVKKHLGKGGRGAKLVWSVIGSLDTMDLEHARERAKETLALIRAGINPNDKTRATREADIAAHRDGKLGELWDTWLAKSRCRGKVKRLKGTDYWHGIERLGKVEIVPVLGPTKPVRDITRGDIRKLIQDKEKVSPAVARMMFACLRPFFSWCVDQEAITLSPVTDIKAPKPVKARARVLTDRELLLAWYAASDTDYPFGSFYKLCVLTAQRRDEVATMEWTELDLAKREWIIPAHKTKNGREHLVHLSNWAMDIIFSLQTRAKVRAKDTGKPIGPFVFTTQDGKAISGFSKAKTFLDKKIAKLNDGTEVPRFTVHDLRRTAATGMGGLKIPPHVVERILNHVSGVNGGIVGIYQRFEYADERREAMVKWAKHINDLVLADMKKERDNTNVLAFNAS